MASLALLFELGDLAIERRRDLFLRDRFARSAQLPGMDFAFVRRSIDSTSEPPCARVLRRQAHLRQRLVDQERRRHQALAARRLDAAQLAIELFRVRLQPGEIRVRIGGVFDRMIAVEESREVEIGADVLDHDVRRVAPAANGDVAVRKREAVGSELIGAAHDLDAGARRMRQAGDIKGLRLFEILPDLAGDLLLPVGGSIGELRSQRRPRAGVDAERRRALGREAQVALADLIEQRERVLLAVGLRSAGAGEEELPLQASGTARRQWRPAPQWLRGDSRLATYCGNDSPNPAFDIIRM